MQHDGNQATWPDLVEGLYSRLTGRGAEIAYEFDEVVVEVPGDTQPGSPRGTWELNGTLRVTTSEPGRR